MSRPELTAPPEIFYNTTEASKYTANSRIITIQTDMTYRALELLNLSKKSYLLDIGCGSGLSGEVLEEEGHVWVGMDISEAMLDVANERDVEGDLMLQDIGQGIAFRPGTFDGCISVSVIQWLCNADRKSHNPRSRLTRFFTSLFTALCKGARAVFQFYPSDVDQIEMIVSAAMRAGFSGGLVVDYPNSTKAKKYYLCLFAGVARPDMPKALDEEVPTSSNKNVQFSTARIRERKGKDKKNAKDKNWVLKKKEARRKQGKATATDSKFTARKRNTRF